MLETTAAACKLKGGDGNVPQFNEATRATTIGLSKEETAVRSHTTRNRYEPIFRVECSLSKSSLLPWAFAVILSVSSGW